MHARNKYFRSEEEKDILLQEIAELTEDFTGAELQNILYGMLSIDFGDSTFGKLVNHSETEWQE